MKLPKLVPRRRQVRGVPASLGFLRTMGAGAAVHALAAVVTLVACGLLDWLSLSHGPTSSTVGLWWRCDAVGLVEHCSVGNVPGDRRLLACCLGRSGGECVRAVLHRTAWAAARALQQLLFGRGRGGEGGGEGR